MADTYQVLNLAAIIREVDGTHSKGAAALAESILDHPDFRAALADEPAAPKGREPAAVTGQPSDGEVAELVAWFSKKQKSYECFGCYDAAAKLTRAAELLERQVLVPVAVSDALIKAECALSDIAEGEPMADEGDPLKWVERRCADTLAIIRPTMMQHKIRTSEWPPVAATAKPLPEVGE